MLLPASVSVRSAARPASERPIGPAREFSAAHLVGICGSGMKSLAELLRGLGWKVSGSDLQAASASTEWFRRRGMSVHQGHNIGYLPDDAEVLVYSPAIGPQNAEREEAVARRIPQLSYSEMLGHLMRDKIGVSIAGTHGKSTTTAMTASILKADGLSPSLIVGADFCGGRPGGWAGESNLFVVESCEYQKSFLNLTPRYAAILGIEPDHFDFFPNFSATIEAFAQFAQRVPEEGVIVIRSDCKASATACADIAADVQTVSFDPGADWWAADLRPAKAGIRFRIFNRGEYFTEVELRTPGRHSVQNALAAAALAHQAGASTRGIRDGLVEFGGIRRRFEFVGSWRGVTLIDDYAHHPTAIQATLETARQCFGQRRICCVFQPHQVSRTQALMAEFGASFSRCDELVIAPVYGARENYRSELEETSLELVRRTAGTGPRARFISSLDRIVATLEDEIRPGDVLITMGAGDINQVHHAFTCRLQRNHAPR